MCSNRSRALRTQLAGSMQQADMRAQAATDRNGSQSDFRSSVASPIYLLPAIPIGHAVDRCGDTVLEQHVIVLARRWNLREPDVPLAVHVDPFCKLH